jgi:glycosyltransferase involved in cell wall biosynthesis
MTQNNLMNNNLPAGPLAGSLDRADAAGIAGWAVDTANPERRVQLQLRLDGEAAGLLVAHKFRDDLRDAGFGDGRHAFELHIPNGLSPYRAHEISVCRAEDGAELPGSPILVPAQADPADMPVAEMIGGAIEAAIATASDAEIDLLIRHLADRVHQLQTARKQAIPAPMVPLEAAWQRRWTEAPMVPPAPDPRPRALFLDEAVPDPNRDAGSSAVLSHMRALQRAGYRVEFAAAHSMELSGPGVAALQAMDIVVWHAPWVSSIEEVLRRLGDGLAVAYLHRFALMQRYGALVRRWCPRARLLYCVADLHYLRMARRIAVEAGAEASPDPDVALPPEAEGLRTAELLACLAADAVITHSAFELALLRRDVPEADSHLVPWEVPVRARTVRFADRHGVLFVGSFGHAPNLDAAFYLIAKIMPLVWARAPEIDCIIAGSDMPASLREAAAAAGRAHRAGCVVAMGAVPDIVPLQDQVRLSVAPLRYGAGLKGKVLDSMAAGLPCVCTPMAAEGMELPAPLQPLVARGAQALADLIATVHSDPILNRMLSDAAAAWVGHHFSAARIDTAMMAALPLHPARRGGLPG